MGGTSALCKPSATDMGEDAELETAAKAAVSVLRCAFRRTQRFNRLVAKSIETELEMLENVGRISVRGQRPVHAAFGFSEMRPDAAARPVADRQPSPGSDLANELDNALSRLRASAGPED